MRYAIVALKSALYTSYSIKQSPLNLFLKRVITGSEPVPVRMILLQHDIFSGLASLLSTLSFQAKNQTLSSDTFDNASKYRGLLISELLCYFENSRSFFVRKISTSSSSRTSLLQQILVRHDSLLDPNRSANAFTCMQEDIRQSRL